MRNLASIQIIDKIADIPGKDKIGLASFKNVGFKVIVDKTEIKEGETVVYFEVDSLLPPDEKFEFLRKRCWNEKWGGHRIRAMKLGGLYSEGLCLSCSYLDIKSLKEGSDVTDLLKVRKYDPELLEEQKMNLNKKQNFIMKFFYQFAWFRLMMNFFRSIFKKKKKDSFPKFLHKTDETRVQNLNCVFDEKFKGKEVYISEKVDGSSLTAYIYKGKFGICSRNLELAKEPNNRFWQYALKVDLEKKMKAAQKGYGFDFAIQLELCGPGIQGNKYGFTSLKGFIFNLFRIDTQEYAGLITVKMFCNTYDLEMVPVLDIMNFNWNNADELLKYADGYSVFGEKVLREGVVVRPVFPLPPERGMSNMWSFKVISPSFLLKHNE